MASQDGNYSGSCQIRGEPPHVLRTTGDKRAKLLADAQRMANATLKQRPGWLLPECEDTRNVTIKRLQVQLTKMAQILVDNRLMKPPRMDEGEPSRGKSRGPRNPPCGTHWEKQHESRVDLDNQDDSRSGPTQAWTFATHSMPKEIEKVISGRNSITEQQQRMSKLSC